MRKSIPTEQRAISKPISLFPSQLAFATKRANQCGISLSRYFQSLADLDKKKDVFREAMTVNLKPIPVSK